MIGRVQGVQSLHRSLDGGLTWTHITDSQQRFPTAQVITGDPGAFGRVLILARPMRGAHTTVLRLHRSCDSR
jgi:hypothetical protein